MLYLLHLDGDLIVDLNDSPKIMLKMQCLLHLDDDLAAFFESFVKIIRETLKLLRLDGDFNESFISGKSAVSNRRISP